MANEGSNKTKTVLNSSDFKDLNPSSTGIDLEYVKLRKVNRQQTWVSKQIKSVKNMRSIMLKEKMKTECLVVQNKEIIFFSVCVYIHMLCVYVHIYMYAYTYSQTYFLWENDREPILHRL